MFSVYRMTFRKLLVFSIEATNVHNILSHAAVRIFIYCRPTQMRYKYCCQAINKTKKIVRFINTTYNFSKKCFH